MNANNNPFNFGMNNGNFNNMNNNINNQMAFNNQIIRMNNNMNNYMNTINNFNCFQNQNMNMNNFNQLNNNINISNNNMNMNNNQNNILNNNMNQNFFCNQFNNINLNGPENIQLNLNNNNIIKINDENSDDDSETFNNYETRCKYDLICNYKLSKATKNLGITMEGTKIIYEQMKNCICLVNNDYTGFFCYIPLRDKKIPVLIIPSSIIYENEIIASMDENKLQKKINLNKNKIINNNNKYNISIIEISLDDNLNKNNFLELDENLFTDNAKILYENKSLYCLSYSYEKKASISYGVLNKKIGHNLIHSCKINSGGGPILNLENNRVIGLNLRNYTNEGIFLKYILNDLNQIKNQITIIMDIEEENLKEDIYFLNNIEIGNNHPNLKELNENNVKLFINGVEHKFQKYFRPNEIGKYSIILKFNENIKDCSYMFYNCNNIINIDLSSFNNNFIDNMNSMFSGCFHLEYVDLYSIDTKNVTDMSNIFKGCYCLNFLDLSGFNTEKVTNMKNMFDHCQNLKEINLCSFNTKNVIDMSRMFYHCVKLINCNLFTFRTKNVQSMEYMFFWCGNLKKIDLSNFNINKVKNKNNMFYLSSLDCSNDMNPKQIKKVKVNKKSYDEFKKLITSKSVKFCIY